LRTLIVVGLVFFHSARVFDTGDFYVKNEPRSELIDVVLAFASVWGMPLLFVISGMGIWYSLRKRSPGRFAPERVRRLLVPLVFGVLVIVPPQVWTRLRADFVPGRRCP
jgi:peptidoglycan/LPS O-acetylase OafA/YrhL